jgi:hypothetical protein
LAKQHTEAQFRPIAGFSLDIKKALPKAPRSKFAVFCPIPAYPAQTIRVHAEAWQSRERAGKDEKKSGRRERLMERIVLFE